MPATPRAKDPLGQPNRRTLHDCIRDHPGITFRALLRCSGVAAGTARHHLSVLQRAALVEERRHRATVRFFLAGCAEAEDWRAAIMRREPPLHRLHSWIDAHPGIIQRDLLDHAETAWGWRRSTTQHRLWRLVEDGLVVQREQGRRKVYTTARAMPDPAPPPLLRRLEARLHAGGAAAAAAAGAAGSHAPRIQAMVQKTYPA